MGLQGHGLDTGLAQLLRRAARGRKAFDLVPGLLRALAHHGQRRRLARARDSIQTDDLLAREKDLIHRLALAGIQLRVPVYGCDTNVCRYQHRIAKAAPVALLHLADGLALHAQHGGGGVLLARVPNLASASTARNSPVWTLRSNSCRTWEKFASPMLLPSAADRIARSFSTAERSKRWSRA